MDDTANVLEQQQPRPRQKPGPRKSKGTETTITKRILDDDDDDDVGADEPVPSLLFHNPNQQFAKIRVHRTEPNEGMLGYLEDVDATEKTLYDKWGGSVFRLEAVDQTGRIRAVRVLRIAGDPVFVSSMAKAEWEKRKFINAQAANPPPPNSGPDVQTILAMVEEREDKRRAELEAKLAAERQERADREAERRREEREWQAERDRQQREFDDRRRREDEAREEKRRRDDEERDRRRREEQKEALQQQQQFMTQMLGIVQASSAQSIAFVKETVAAQQAKPATDGSEMLLKGVTLAMQLKEMAGGGSDAEEPILTTVIKNLPDILNGAGNAVGKAIREVKGEPAPEPGTLTLRGAAAEKVGALAQKIEASGGNAEQALATIADRLLGNKPKQAAQVAADPATGPKPIVYDSPPPGTPMEEPKKEAAPVQAEAAAKTEEKPANKAAPIRMKFAK